MAIQVTRTYVATIRLSNRSRVIWTRLGLPPRNSGTSHAGRATVSGARQGQSPRMAHSHLIYLKNHERYADLNSSVSESLKNSLKRSTGGMPNAETGTTAQTAPKYRKNGDNHPRSTVTFKEDGFKHDSKNNRIRLERPNLKEHWSDFILHRRDRNPARCCCRECSSDKSSLEWRRMGTSYRLQT